VNASRHPSRDTVHHSGSGRLAIPFPMGDFHLLFFASKTGALRIGSKCEEELNVRKASQHCPNDRTFFVCARSSQVGPECDLTKTAAHGFQRSRGRAGLAAMREMVQLARPRRNSMIAALTSAGRSCWVQCPQPGSIWMSRSRGTTCFMLAICSAAPGNATTMS
jgi:hypothetical protein